MRSTLILGACVATAATFSFFSCRTSSEPVVAQQPDACAIALAPSDSRDDADRAIARLQQAVRHGADAVGSLERLGHRYLERARQQGNEGDYVLAAKAAECVLVREPGHPSALLLRGHVLHQMHRFDEAEAIARRLTGQREFVLDHGLLGDVLMERGRLSEAAVAYQKMIDLKPSYQSYVRAAHLRWLRGDLRDAVALLEMAIAAASPRDPESSAWAYSRLATYEMQAGRLKEAERAVDAALRRKRDYPAALLAKGRLLLAMNRPDEAVSPLRRAVELTGLPDSQWALVDALGLIDRHEDARGVEQELTRGGETADPRTLALFLATRRRSPARAVELATRELTVRQDVFTLDALAWALAAAGRTAEAESFIRRALAEGTQDGRLFLHAAAIYAAAGRRDDAVRWLGRAERLRATLLPSELDELRTIRNEHAAQQENSK